MSGSRDANLRAGDLCEGIGLELLRSFAFVAPVPRQDDVGIDAVATLIRREGRRLLAEDSFLVQVKAASIRKLEYEGESLEWLRALRLPFFILSVDLPNATVELRSIIRALGHPNFSDRTKVTMYLDEKQFDIPGNEMHVWLRSPILRWTAADAAKADFQTSAYAILKDWMTFETENMSLRALGITRQLEWQTNDKPSLHGAFAILHNPSELQGVLEKIRPSIQRLISLACPLQDQTDTLLMGLLLISQYMREHDVDPDEAGMLRAFAQIRAKKDEENPSTGS